MSPARKFAQKRSIREIDSNFKSISNKRRRLERDSNQPMKFIPLNKRHFYHIRSNQPFLIENTDAMDDSDDEMEHVTMYQQIHQSEMNRKPFLNNGEKEMMNLWNTFIDSQKGFGQQHMPDICQRFIHMHVGDILEKKLYRNFLLHLCTLHDAGIINAFDYVVLVQYIQRKVGINAFKIIVDSKVEKKRKGEPKIKKKSKTPTNNNNKENNNNDNHTEKQQRYALRSAKSAAESNDILSPMKATN